MRTKEQVQRDRSKARMQASAWVVVNAGLRMRTEVFEIFEVRRHIAGERVVMEEASSGVGPNRSASKGSSKAAPLGIVRSSKHAKQ